MALDITQANFQEEVLNSSVPVLVDFWAPWCGPCRMQAPVLDSLADSNANIKIVKVNVDENMELASEYQIMSIPSLLLFRDGKLAGSRVGLQNLSSLLEFVQG